MVYRAIGLMSGSSLDGLDIAFAEFQEQGGKWSYEILKTGCYAYSDEWTAKLQQAIHLSARDYQLLHAEYGHYLGHQVNAFIDENRLQYKVAVIASHGHTTFHMPGQKMTAQLGDGAAIAAETQLPVVTDLRALDVAFGGQGAPIVPIGEKLLMNEYSYFLNIGGIANISVNDNPYIAFDICPANRVLNMLANDVGKSYDDGGMIAASGVVNTTLLEKLNDLSYYKLPPPKSLANDFGTDIIYPMIKELGCKTEDALRTYTEHIAYQVKQAMTNSNIPNPGSRLLVTGGGAFNQFLIQRLSEQLKESGIAVIVPDADLVNYKEALIMAFIGVLRWRQENNVLASVTGAARDSIGGALWTGQEA
ncbi:MAG: anhydro-N-acetylmuramic acid kinase [Chitinophagaceae bacterium]|jgi:anhydro-N-acetylmuramic acid kinase|nr:anhydro-N-acetylmuramic acid kinase [Chitinophagaceae bacterium]MBK7678671.1 anhydro-N-acetylmuramic acid kinase [Chitinophagaceae bacterium]MBK8299979.1 anhydro-N-acetylmuramic acid kinase [Chitinophagaceae bacterium]MBK9464023.1 anhydro-N-acetylmuramic acid kinase [Chitinophagaceae bacterium]MBK9658857.1 anhydro-N-acetylmuramic acid kinase [Chitinophagaceae bacterium]